MPCTPVTLPGGIRAIVCTRGRRQPPKPCAALVPTGSASGSTTRCCAASAFLCDWRLADGSTCDAPLCADHAHEVGHDRHLCPLHLQQEREGAEPAPAEREPVQERLF